MSSTEYLLKELDNIVFEFTQEQIDDINNSENSISVLRKISSILLTCEDDLKINYFNKNIIIFLSHDKGNYGNIYYFLQEADNTIWNYILENFDDDKLHSIIVVFYLCLVHTKIQPEYIFKVLKIFFSDLRMCDLVTDTEVFFYDADNKYSNSQKTIMGILFSRISQSDTYYEARIQKTVELFYILLRNRVAKPKLLRWVTQVINDNKNFGNNYSFYEDYDKTTITPSYYKLLTRVFYKLWEDSKSKPDKNKFENINMNYLKQKNCLLEWEDEDETIIFKSKIFEDIFFIFTRLQNIFFNNLEIMVKDYNSFINDTTKELRRLELTGLTESLKNTILEHLTQARLIKEDLTSILNDVRFTSVLKNFQKDFADIININLKKKNNILDSILETNIDLINSLKIFEDSFYNYNYTNFENSVILFNYPELKNPHIKNKYCIYASYYIVDNTSRNVCDLRYKFITHTLIPNLISFYIHLEDLEEDNFYDKNYARTNIINFLNFICFKEPYIYAEQLKKYAKSDNKNYVRFVNLYINDLSLTFDETFTLIKEVNIIEREDIRVSLLNREDIYNDRPEHRKLYKKYRYIDSFLSTLKFMLSFLLILSKYSDRILMSSELGIKFCSQINYFLNELTNKDKRKLYIIKNKYDVQFNPLQLLNYLSKTMINLIQYDNFILYMSKDLRSFRKENMTFLTDKLWSNNMLTDSEARKLELISNKVCDLIEKDKLEIEVPDEFCDPLMASEINDPIILPGTDTIMDKSVISRHLLTDQHNPFNRDKLTLDELEKYNSQEHIKDKINTFINKKNKWKFENT